VGVDVVPELAEEGFIRVVLDVRLLVGHLKIGTKLVRNGEKMIAMRSEKELYWLNSSRKWKLQSLESIRISFSSKAML
jgi:hypothetical protein